MNGDQALQMVAAAMCLVLVGSAFVARRVPLGQAAKMALGWLAIFALLLLAFSFKDDIGDRLRFAIHPDRGTVVGETLRIPMGDDGHFWVRGSVNGVETRFLVDSGATTTALSAAAASAAGIDPADDPFGTPVATANGTVMARRVRIADLRIGPIRRADVRATTAAEFADMNVLGMNFLNSLSGWGVEGRTLVLKP
ncbi:TIGR02281 family clan AA aspartic protease [Sphingomonas fennica]|uniref:TIGR02281 family clan AA aspartic protease n=1 Tax=Edaphosphingomonas fennica TaxID=114404 RepID=A0A2T4I4P6_9SPHN|nr:TIGR02281 family clan AA aspartic protease [Sphingomonas fennica]PTD24471.1 TIGR02281 family clan AA aspartic protease [Sphingomonas fennica]